MFVTYADLPVTRFHVLWKQTEELKSSQEKIIYWVLHTFQKLKKKRSKKKNWKEKNRKTTATPSSKQLQECLTARQLMLLQCEQPKKWSKHMQRWNEIKHSSEIL